MALTPKQEKFCEQIVAGNSGKDSYMTAYGNNSNDNTAYKEAMKLLARGDIQARIKELRKPLEIHAQTTALTDREKKRAWLWEIINDVNRDDNNRLRAMDILCKVDAEYTNVNVNQNNSTLDLSTVDITALKRISGQE